MLFRVFSEGFTAASAASARCHLTALALRRALRPSSPGCSQRKLYSADAGARTRVFHTRSCLTWMWMRPGMFLVSLSRAREKWSSPP